jgi:hypothetical protein
VSYNTDPEHFNAISRQPNQWYVTNTADGRSWLAIIDAYGNKQVRASNHQYLSPDSPITAAVWNAIGRLES